EHAWVTPAEEKGLKLTWLWGWAWKDRKPPDPVVAASRSGVPERMVQRSVVEGIAISTALPGHEYAAVTHPDGSRTVCPAQGLGGFIDVTCDAPAAGVLTVLENSWSGWQAAVDSRSVPLRSEQWLSVDVPAGRHSIQ